MCAQHAVDTKLSEEGSAYPTELLPLRTEGRPTLHYCESVQQCPLTEC